MRTHNKTSNVHSEISVISSRIIRIHLAIGETPPFHAPFWFQSNRSHAVIHREYYPFLKILNRFRPRCTRGGRQLVDGRITVFPSVKSRDLSFALIWAYNFATTRNNTRIGARKCLQFVAIIVCFDNCNSSWFMDY